MRYDQLIEDFFKAVDKKTYVKFQGKKLIYLKELTYDSAGSILVGFDTKAKQDDNMIIFEDKDIRKLAIICKRIIKE